jgi:dihydroorotate dehydrogenase electron transfer subunit
VRPFGAELAERREIGPGEWLLAWHAPAIASAARAGQALHVRTVEAGGMPLRRPFPIATADPSSGTLTIQASGHADAAGSSPPAWAAALRPGDRADLGGPIGRPLEVDPRSRHLLLIAEGPSIAGLRLLIDEAVRDGRSVVLIHGARTAAAVYPSSLLPDEVEYVVATEDGSLGHRGSVGDLALEYEAWADQAFAAGPPPLLAGLATLALGRRQRLGVATLGRKRGGGRPIVPGSPEARRKAWLQVVLGQTIGCAAGTCLGCVVDGARGTVRVCREGPSFAADEIDWERAS